MFFLKLQLHTDSHTDDLDAELWRGNIWNSYTAHEFRLTANLCAPRGSEVHLVMEMVWKCRMQIETTHPQINCYKQSSPVADLLFISCSDTSTWWGFVGKPLPPFINMKGSFGTFYLMRCFVSFSIYVKQCFLFVESFPSEFQFLLVCKSLDLHTHTIPLFSEIV